MNAEVLDRLGHVFDERVNLRLVGAEAEHADAAQRAARNPRPHAMSQRRRRIWMRTKFRFKFYLLIFCCIFF